MNCTTSDPDNLTDLSFHFQFIDMTLGNDVIIKQEDGFIKWQPPQRTARHTGKLITAESKRSNKNKSSDNVNQSRKKPYGVLVVHLFTFLC